ncbi:MAG: FCD domain-containing protein [Anaerolineaceae bacterium]|nr:FCD domain-containing protein [Anaerolineaceae bacterium]MDD4043361.1 FCD domain-containing protein [Anaerolineaceae bacterium]MDD4577965.1 FCD domain-containing protein [Anaerolineaceae bacterium]
MKNSNLALLSYLASNAKEGKSIPSIAQLSNDLGLSTSSVREQLEVARQLELVEVKTKTGIQTSTFSAAPAICLAYRFGLELQPDIIWDLLSVRQHLELSYWQEALGNLTKKDVAYLAEIVESAFMKIESRPVIIPVEEHKEFHLSIYRPLNNNFLNSILESYWNINEETGKSILTDKTDLLNIWTYHRKIQQAIATKEYDLGYQALMTHFEILKIQKKAELKQRFE